MRRIHDAGGLTREEFWEAYHAEVVRLRALPRGTGGNFGEDRAEFDETRLRGFSRNTGVTG